MKKYLSYSIISISLLFLFVACKKKESSSPSSSTTSVPIISKEIDRLGSGNDTSKYYYNSSWKLIKMTESSDTSYATIDYTNSTTITYKSFNKNSQPQEQIVYTLDSNGYISSAIQIIKKVMSSKLMKKLFPKPLQQI